MFSLCCADFFMATPAFYSVKTCMFRSKPSLGVCESDVLFLSCDGQVICPDRQNLCVGADRP